MGRTGICGVITVPFPAHVSLSFVFAFCPVERPEKMLYELQEMKNVYNKRGFLNKAREADISQLMEKP